MAEARNPTRNPTRISRNPTLIPYAGYRVPSPPE
jgi:hypothetical protein